VGLTTPSKATSRSWEFTVDMRRDPLGMSLRSLHPLAPRLAKARRRRLRLGIGGSEMKLYYVYIDTVVGISRVHVARDAGGCGAYERRRPTREKNNRWTGPIPKQEWAEATGRLDGHPVVCCKRCKFPEPTTA
jgi:hypothetical protein